MKTSKLLRDKRGDHQPEHQEYLRRGGEPYRTVLVDESAMNLLLIGKLHEEAEEIREHLTDPSEYADALEVLRALAARNGVSWAEVLAVGNEKCHHAGGFTSPRILVRD